MTNKIDYKKVESREDAESFLDQFDTFLFDCDGVIWRGNKMLTNASNTIDLLRKRGKEICFVTNNSSNSRQMFHEILNKKGIPSSIDEIFTSAYTSAVYLKNVLKIPKNKQVYVIGEKGIEEELRQQEIKFSGGTDSKELEAMNVGDFDPDKLDKDVASVVCGIDFHISYKKYCKAFTYLSDSSCHFIATNEDTTFPTAKGMLPGSGAIVSVLSVATGRKPKVVGKAHKEMMDAIDSIKNLKRSRTCFIGDRLDTDIKFANENGLGGSMLVLSGVSSLDDVSEKSDMPTHVCSYVGRLFELIQQLEC